MLSSVVDYECEYSKIDTRVDLEHKSSLIRLPAITDSYLAIKGLILSVIQENFCFMLSAQVAE